MKINEHLFPSLPLETHQEGMEAGREGGRDGGTEGVRPTLSIFSLEYSKKPGSQKAKLSLTGIWEGGDHLSQGSLSTHTGKSVVICKQKPWERPSRKLFSYLMQNF